MLKASTKSSPSAKKLCKSLPEILYTYYTYVYFKQAGLTGVLRLCKKYNKSLILDICPVFILFIRLKKRLDLYVLHKNSYFKESRGSFKSGNNFLAQKQHIPDVS